jgi:hypothetical protein
LLRGAFGIGPNGRPTIEIKDAKGDVSRPRWDTVGFWGKGKAAVVPEK